MTITLLHKTHTGGIRENTNFWFVTEDGLYEVLMQSRKPIAKQFKKKVKEILKEIRKTGSYIVDNDNARINAIQKGVSKTNSLETLELIQSLIDEQKILLIENEKQKQLLLYQEPKVEFCDNILKSKDTLSTTVIAKQYGRSAMAFNKLLHDLKVQFKQSGLWILYKEHQDKGYTQTETYSYTDSHGETKVTVNNKWTQKGRLFLYELLKSKGILPLEE